MINSDKVEKVLWSIAFPGFGQLLNGNVLKGLFFITIELVVNFLSNLNTAIIYSFNGDIVESISKTNYQWLMFYPCIYMYAIWDAYKNAKGENSPFAFLPFVVAAYLGTIGVVYSKSFNIYGILLGPIWLAIICLIAGVFIGRIIQKQITKRLY